MSTFGTIFSFHFVEQWLLELADKWYTEYLSEVERQLGEPHHTFTTLADFGTANEFGKWPEEHLPFLLVMYTGLNEQPKKSGDGKWRARALFNATVIVSGQTKSATRYLMHVHSAVFKALLLQHTSLEHPEHIDGVTWVDERPAPLARESERSLAAMQMFFIVDVKNILDEGGVSTFHPNPNPDPYGPPLDPYVVLPVEEGSNTPRGGVSMSITQKEIQ